MACNYRATLVDTGQRAPGKCAVLQLQDAQAGIPESPVRITLLQAISRGDRMDTSIRQSVELGVAHVQPLYTRQAAKALDERRTAKKLEHWQAILVSACEQSGRARLAHWQRLSPCSNGCKTRRRSRRIRGLNTPSFWTRRQRKSLVSHLHKMKTDTPAVQPSGQSAAPDMISA